MKSVTTLSRRRFAVSHLQNKFVADGLGFYHTLLSLLIGADVQSTLYLQDIHDCKISRDAALPSIYSYVNPG